MVADLFPGHIATPLVTREANGQGWMLLPEIQGTQMRDVPFDLRLWEQALDILAYMQLACVGKTDELLAVGCADRRLSTLPSEIDGLLGDEDLLSRLDAAQVEELRALAPAMKSLSERLASYNIPQTLMHGDLHAGNIMVRDGKLVIFYWTDACVTHPFFDLLTLFRYDFPKNMPEEHERLIGRYLRRWTDYEPLNRIMEAYKLAEPVGALHHAISYRRILAAIEPSSRWEFGDDAADWIPALIGAVKQVTSQ
jgi:hypothetical protein